MKSLPIIKAEFKRSAWVLWAALFVLMPACIGGAVNGMRLTAEYMVMSLESEIYISSDILNNLFTPTILWVWLLVYVQYANDRPDFTRTLPYTGRQLVLSKFVTAVFIAAVLSVMYIVFMLGILQRFLWLTTAAAWSNSAQYVDVFDKNFIFISAAAVFLLAIAIYWYISLCCCVSKRIVTGMFLSLLGFFTFVGFMNLSNYFNNIDVLEVLRKILRVFGLEGYSVSIFIILFASMLILLMAPAVLRLYGGGSSTHPLFRYAGAGKAAFVLIVLFLAFLTPEYIDMTDNIPLAMIIGGTVGAGIGAAANKLIVRRCEK